VAEAIYSTAHPGFEGEPEGEGITVTIPVPAGDEHVGENKVATPAADNVTQEYAQKGIFFVVILAVVAWFIRRSRTSHKIDEKSMA
jgi:hypothetical protein